MNGMPPSDPSHRRSPKSIMSNAMGSSNESIGKPPKLRSARWSYQDITIFERHEDEDMPRRRFDGSISSFQPSAPKKEPFGSDAASSRSSVQDMDNKSFDTMNRSLDLIAKERRKNEIPVEKKLTRKWKSVLSLKSMGEEKPYGSDRSSPAPGTANPLAGFHELDNKSFDAMSKSLEAIVKERRKTEASDKKQSKSQKGMPANPFKSGKPAKDSSRSNRRDSLPDGELSRRPSSKLSKLRTPRNSVVDLSQLSNIQNRMAALELENMEVQVLREKVRELESALVTRQ